MLQLERDQQRVDLRRSLAETEAIARQAREEYDNKVSIVLVQTENCGSFLG